MNDLLVNIRHAKREDAKALSRVYEAAWREAYQGIIPSIALEKMIARRSPAWWQATLSKGRPLAVLDIGQGIVGYVSYGRTRDRSLPAEGEIDEFYLCPTHQGLGFGRRLFKAVRNDLAARDMHRVVVWALADNERACSFYTNLGGRVIAGTTERFGDQALTKVAYLFR